MKQKLKEWNRKRPKNEDIIINTKSQLRDIQESLDKDPLNENLNSLYYQIQGKLKEELYKQAMEIKQKAKENWLTQADECTKFFYTKMSQRTHYNNLLNCLNVEGNVVNNLKEIEDNALSYFMKLYNGNSTQKLPTVHCRRKIFQEGCSMLTARITERELWRAIQSIHIDSSPGPDGMGAAVFKMHWIHLKNLMLQAYQEALDNGEFLQEINHTFISLIPKVKKPNRIEDYMSISCCNVSYKIFSKIIYSRLNKVLTDLIAQNQNAFIKVRFISENSLLAHELIRDFNKPEADKMCFKVDLHKAYDKVNRNFVVHMLKAMGVPDNILKLISFCISIPTFSILINGVPKGYISSNRGIRQGDPLSPYLFAIVMEWFSLQMEIECHQNNVIPVHKITPKITHLIYADDLIIVIKASTHAIDTLKDIFYHLELYGELKLNEGKTKCYFNKFCKDKQRLLIRIGVSEGELSVKYLRIPLSTNTITDRECAKLIDKVREKVQGWMSKLLSFAGRVELVHTMITSKVRYWLQTFHIPYCSLGKINSVCVDFIWRGKLHKISYKDLYKPKNEGGVGLKGLFELKKFMVSSWFGIYNLLATYGPSG